MFSKPRRIKERMNVRLSPVNGKACERKMKRQYCMDLPVYTESSCNNMSTAIVAEFGAYVQRCNAARER
jgi:hypothetical protein